MKKLTALILALLMLTAVFAGCGDSTDQPQNPDASTENKPDNTQPDDSTQTKDPDSTQSGDSQGGSTTDTPQKEETPDPTSLRTFDTPEQEALVVVAEAYYARKVYLQYDDTRLVTGNVFSPAIYRWQRHTNSPEDCTRQYTAYTNCAAFCYDVYKEAFDLDIVHWYTAALDTAKDMQVFYHKITGKETDAEKKAIEEQYRSLLQPGDIINCRHADQQSGHAMLYVGDGQILHSSAPGGGNYDYGQNVDKIEPRGSIAYRSLDELFTEGENCYFWTESSYSIVRPLIKYTDVTITEETQARIKNLQNVYVEKLSSHTVSQTADLGEEITFTFFIRNGRTDSVELTVTDTVPANSTYVSGGDKVDGNDLSWVVKLASGETAEVSYTVRVNNDPALYNGGYIYSDDATVGGVGVRCQPVYVGRHLTADQMSAVTAAADKQAAATQRGIALAEKIYADAGITVTVDGVSATLNEVFSLYGNTTTHYVLNTANKYMSLIAPTMYGGYYVGTSNYYYGSRRTSGILAVQMYVGDILMCVEAGKEQSNIYTGNNKVMDLNSGKILDLMETRDALMSPCGYDRFVVIRPGAGL